jgi:Tfp pilus assembly protein PilO
MARKGYRGTWIVTIVLAASAVAYLVLVFLPGRRAMGEFQQELARRQGYLAQNSGISRALASAEQELDKAEAHYAAWKQRAPGEGQLSTLYGKINELAKAAGTTTTRFDPKPVESHEQVREIPLTMGCSGTFAQLFDLLKSLESLPGTIWIDTVQFRKVTEKSEAVACEINLVVFVNNSENSDYVKHSE